jgi:hypothetical protein
MARWLKGLGERLPVAILVRAALRNVLRSDVLQIDEIFGNTAISDNLQHGRPSGESLPGLIDDRQTDLLSRAQES